MIRLKSLLVLFTFICTFSPLHAASVAKELNWSSVNLSGMHLRLVSPKSNTESRDLYFHADGGLSISSCNDGSCVGPLIVWKIENNRLKTGYTPDEGYALVEFTAQKIVLRSPKEEIYVYSIIPKERP